MKKISLLAATAALFLTVTPFAQAGTPAKAKKHAAKKTVQATSAVDYNAVIIRAPQSDDAAYGTELGSDAPHEERNPSQHPPLHQNTRTPPPSRPPPTPPAGDPPGRPGGGFFFPRPRTVFNAGRFCVNSRP